MRRAVRIRRGRVRSHQHAFLTRFIQYSKSHLFCLGTNVIVSVFVELKYRKDAPLWRRITKQTSSHTWRVETFEPLQLTTM